MAVSATPSTLSTIDEYLLDSYKKAGLIPLEADIGFDASWNAKAAHGRKIMNRVIEGLATEGFLDYFVPFEVVDLISGQALYTQGTDFDTAGTILNFVDSGSYIPESNDPEEVETTSETPVSPMSAHQWQTLATKNAEGKVTRYYLQRNGSLLHLYLWPIPNEDAKIRFRVLRIPGSSSTGSDNADLKRHWGDWLVHAIAYQLMTDAKLPIEERTLCRSDRDAIMNKLKTCETSNEPPDVIFNHTTPWSNF